MSTRDVKLLAAAARKGGSIKAAASPAKAAALAALADSRRGLRVHPLPARVSRALVLIRTLLDEHPRLDSIRAQAARMDVSDKTLRRWMSGEDHPNPIHHPALIEWAAKLKSNVTK